MSSSWLRWIFVSKYEKNRARIAARAELIEAGLLPKSTFDEKEQELERALSLWTQEVWTLKNQLRQTLSALGAREHERDLALLLLTKRGRDKYDRTLRAYESRAIASLRDSEDK